MRKKSKNVPGLAKRTPKKGEQRVEGEGQGARKIQDEMVSETQRPEGEER